MSSPLLVDLLAYWNLNDNGSGGVSLVDSTGNGYTLTNNGGVTLGTGIIGGDGVFDANSSQTLTNGPGNIALQTSFSASVWFQLASTTQGTRQDIFDSVTDIGFNIFVDDLNFVNIAYGTGGGGAAVLTTSYQVNDTNWHYVATTFDGNTSQLIAYVDGANVGSVNTGNPASPWAGGYPTSLGSTGNSFYYTGGIDEAGLWGRVLTPTEVSDLYYAGLGNTYPFTNPVPVPLTIECQAYWNLNDNGSGGVSLLDSTGNGNTLTSQGTGTTLGTGIIGGCAVFDGSGYFESTSTFNATYPLTYSSWIKSSSVSQSGAWGGNGTGYPGEFRLLGIGGDIYFQAPNAVTVNTTGGSYNDNAWHYVVGVADGTNISIYVDGSLVAQTANNSTGQSAISYLIGSLGNQPAGPSSIDEVGVWTRALSSDDIASLWNGGAGKTYPFTSSSTLYYNNAQSDGDWGNILNWWQDSGFTVQATALPTNINPVNLYNQVTQNTQGANQCFCSTANFWSADFGAGLTLQATGVVNMQGSSILAGTTTDGVSMHDSSQIASTGVVTGNAVLRDGSRNFGTITGNATVYYDSGNGHLPIGGTVNGTTSYLDWGYIAPCPSVGGGNATISRLLHLPWFINI